MVEKRKKPAVTLKRLEARHVELLEKLDVLDKRVDEALSEFGCQEKEDIST